MKKRLDVLMVEKKLATGRDNAKELIAENKVYVAEKLITKASTQLDDDVLIEIRGEVIPYVSRAGLKLEKALEEFNISVSDKTCMDIGSSTGGFTDCLLQNNAKKVYAIDVGTDQLVQKLREDERVVVMENTNIRYLEADEIQDKIDFISIDVSFISLRLVLPKAYEFLTDGGQLVCLIKPQFEAGASNIGKNGIVKDRKVHKMVLEEITNFAKELGFTLSGLTFSPIKGQKGNTEYLLFAEKSNKGSSFDNSVINNIITQF